MASKDPWHRNRLIRDGIYRAIQERMAVDSSIYIMGEGSHMKIHFDAPEINRLYCERVLTLPISEDANTNFAVGLSLAGVLPIVDVISSDFLYRTMDAICNTAAKIGHVNSPRPIIIRAEFLTGGPTSGQRIENLFTHIPGLNVVVPSNPRDAYRLMRTALDTNGVTLFFEDRMIEDSTTSEYDKLGDSQPAPVPFGSARIVDEGHGLTVVSYGLTLRHISRFLHAYELIDLRTLYPLDMVTILNSVRKTGALLVVEPAVKHGGVGAEIVAQVAEAGFTRVARLGGVRTTIPACRDLHDRLLPSEEEIMETARRLA